MVGGSNEGRLGVSLDNNGKPAVDVTLSGWSLTPANVNVIKGLLEAECITNRTLLWSSTPWTILAS
jgi:hypothetical protein